MIDSLHIIAAITWKDILDAFSNKIILSMIIAMVIMLLVPKGMALIIVPPYTDVVIFDHNSSRLVSALDDSPQFRVQQVDSIDELEQAISSLGLGIGAKLGLVVPADFDIHLESEQQLELEGYISWSNRNQATELKTDIENQISDLLDRPVQINLERNFVYPPADMTLMLGILTITLVTLILLIGISLVPFLLFEEKQTKTLDALLVSPASISQVVIGKALAGFFYVLVTAGAVFAIYWTGIVNWGLATLFVLCTGLFSVAVGLALGSFFERQQEVSGLIMVLLVFFIAAMFVELLEFELPLFIRVIIPLIPSVALGKVFVASFSNGAPVSTFLWNIVSVVCISILLYAAVIWKNKRLDN